MSGRSCWHGTITTTIVSFFCVFFSDWLPSALIFWLLMLRLSIADGYLHWWRLKSAGKSPNRANLVANKWQTTYPALLMFFSVFPPFLQLIIKNDFVLYFDYLNKLISLIFRFFANFFFLIEFSIRNGFSCHFKFIIKNCFILNLNHFLNNFLKFFKK